MRIPLALSGTPGTGPVAVPTSAPAGATAGTGSYCVQGNTLHITSTMMAMGGAMGTPASDLVATKQ